MEQAQAPTRFNYSIGRLMMMGVLSIVMYLSMVMSVLTPYPVALAFILFGRSKGYIIAGLTIIAFFVLVGQSTQDFSLVGLFIAGIIIAAGLGEVILRKVQPVKAILVIGLIFIAFLGSMILSYQSTRNMSVQEIVLENVTKLKPIFDKQIEEIEKSGAENTLEVIAYLKQPELMAEDIIKKGPGIIVMSMLVVLWANMFLLLKSRRILGGNEDEKYSEKLLIRFEMPDQFIFAVILSLVLAMWGDALGEWGPVTGITLLKILGTFYFFQGFGIYIDFLDHYRIFGFFRTILVVITVLTAYEMLAIFGLFDMFFNFRKFLKKKEDQI